MSTSKYKPYSSSKHIEQLSNYLVDFSYCSTIKKKSDNIICEVSTAIGYLSSDEYHAIGMAYLIAHVDKVNDEVGSLKISIENDITAIEAKISEFKGILNDFIAESKGAMGVDAKVMADLIGLISVNKMKLQNFEQQLSSYWFLHTELSRFLAVTVPHIQVSISEYHQNTRGSYVLTKNNYNSQMNGLRSALGVELTKLIIFIIIIILATIYNFLADNYYLVIKTTSGMANQSDVFYALTEGLSSFYNFFYFLSFIMIIVALIARSYVMVGLLSFSIILTFTLRYLVGREFITVYYEFFSINQYFSLVILALTIPFIIQLIRKKNVYTQLSNWI